MFNTLGVNWSWTRKGFGKKEIGEKYNMSIVISKLLILKKEIGKKN